MPGTLCLAPAMPTRRLVPHMLEEAPIHHHARMTYASIALRSSG
jgi:hypothetical protein